LRERALYAVRTRARGRRAPDRVHAVRVRRIDVGLDPRDQTARLARGRVVARDGCVVVQKRLLPVALQFLRGLRGLVAALVASARLPDDLLGTRDQEVLAQDLRVVAETRSCRQGGVRVAEIVTF